MSHHKKTRNTKRFETNIKKHQKISRLLSDTNISNFLTRKLIEVNDLSYSHYSLNKKNNNHNNNNNKKKLTTIDFDIKPYKKIKTLTTDAGKYQIS